MIKKYPKSIKIIEQSTTTLQVEMVIDPDLFWFQGHFDGLPILAGVAQIDILMHFFNQYMDPSKTFSGSQQIKYQQPIFPNEIITLNIELSAPLQLNFTFMRDNILKSKGKITLIAL